MQITGSTEYLRVPNRYATAERSTTSPRCHEYSGRLSRLHLLSRWACAPYATIKDTHA